MRVLISAEWCYKDDPRRNMRPGVLYGEARRKARDQALKFVISLYNAPIEYVAIENPVGVLATRFMPASQYIQPYQFGDNASKRTGFWLRNLPALVADPAQRCSGRKVFYNGKWVERWANQTDSGQNKLLPSADRWALRSETYPHVAEAMAAQWGSYVARQLSPFELVSQ